VQGGKGGVCDVLSGNNSSRIGVTHLHSKQSVLGNSPTEDTFQMFWKCQIYHVHYGNIAMNIDRLCGLVVRVLGYRSGGPGSIPGTTRKKNLVGPERRPLSLVSTIGELLERKSRGSGPENRGIRHADHALYLQKLALTSPTSCGRSRTQATEFSFLIF
jgi:hypothetical protein